MGSPPSPIICIEPGDPLLNNSRPYNVSENIRSYPRHRQRSFVNLPFLHQPVSIIQLMSNLDTSLHSRSKESVNRGKPPVQWASTTYERRLVGSSRRAMSTTNTSISHF